MIAVGDKLPETTFFEMTAEGPGKVEGGTLFAGRKVVLFGVPGAFTPTCHNKHMPGFVAHAAAMKAKGVDDVICLTVNDPFVVAEWAKATGAAEAGVRVLGDSAAAFAEATGISFDAGAVGLGVRIMRFAAVVEDGTLTVLKVENVPSEADMTSAEAILAEL